MKLESALLKLAKDVETVERKLERIELCAGFLQNRMDEAIDQDAYALLVPNKSGDFCLVKQLLEAVNS